MIEDEIRDVGRELIQEFFEFQTIEGPTSVSRCMTLNQIIGEPDKNWWRGLTRGRPIMRSESFGYEEEDFGKKHRRRFTSRALSFLEYSRLLSIKV